MKNLKAKLQKKGGFTLIEMLIVVAIIAILVAISIPLVGTALDKARDATDNANLRAAKAEALIMYMNDQMNVGGTPTLTDGMRYDIKSGKFLAAASVTTGYNQGKLGGSDAANTKVIQVTVDTTAGVTEPITVAWVAK